MQVRIVGRGDVVRADIDVDVDVDNQYIAVSALRTLTAPVPWDATCEWRAKRVSTCDA
jgi:hypothetical protein